MEKMILVQLGMMMLMSSVCKTCSVGLSLSLGTSEMTDVIRGRGWKRREAIYMYIYQTAWLVQLITPEIRSVLLMLISAVSSGFYIPFGLGYVNRLITCFLILFPKHHLCIAFAREENNWWYKPSCISFYYYLMAAFPSLLRLIKPLNPVQNVHLSSVPATVHVRTGSSYPTILFFFFLLIPLTGAVRRGFHLPSRAE